MGRMTSYFTYHRHSKHYPLTEEAYNKFLEQNADEQPARPPSSVLDLGCGTGRDTVFLLNQGCYVTALDAHPKAIEITREQTSHAADRVTLIQSRIEDMQLPQQYDLISSTLTMPYINASNFHSVWSNIVQHIACGGRFSGQFWGENHDGRFKWVKTKYNTPRFISLSNLLDLFAVMFDIEKLDPFFGERVTTSDGIFLWHQFDVIARKKALSPARPFPDRLYAYNYHNSTTKKDNLLIEYHDGVLQNYPSSSSSNFSSADIHNSHLSPVSMSLSERVIQGLIEKSEIAEADLPVNATELQTEYTLAEAIGADHISLDDIDMVVVLSGRSSFTGTYLESANKYTLCPEQFDSTDTLRRILYGINIAKQCIKNNQSRGVTKPVYVYYNGVKRQNDELKNILKSEGAFYGYPAHLFVIDAIPLDNTMGQVIGLSKYLHTYWPLFCHRYGLLRAPKIVFCTSSYHVPRVSLAFGSESPLLTPEYWSSNPDLLTQLSPEMRAYVLDPGNTLKKAEIIVLGCDRQITANPFWEKDLLSDMQARINYATIRRTSCFGALQMPSIAPVHASNNVTFFKAAVRRSIMLRRLPGMLTSQSIDVSDEFPGHPDDKVEDFFGENKVVAGTVVTDSSCTESISYCP